MSFACKPRTVLGLKCDSGPRITCARECLLNCGGTVFAFTEIKSLCRIARNLLRGCQLLDTLAQIGRVTRNITSFFSESALTHTIVRPDIMNQYIVNPNRIAFKLCDREIIDLALERFTAGLLKVPGTVKSASVVFGSWHLLLSQSDSEAPSPDARVSDTSTR